MKIRGILSAAALTLSAVLSMPAFACAPNEGGFITTTLSGANQPDVVTNLNCGKYEFGGTHSDYDSWFSDRWKLYVSEDTTVSLSVFDIELNLDEANEAFDTAKIFDTKSLSFTIFDDDAGQFLGWAGENETLSGLSLKAGKWYTLKVYGNVGGLFGSVYHGALETSVTQVPLGDTAPMLGSALGLLALRLRKRVTASVNA